MYTTIKTLWVKTKNKSEIARITGHDWKTVAKVIKDIDKGVEIPKKKPKATVIDNFKQEVLKLIEKDLSAVRIHTEPGEEAQVDFGYLGITKDDAGKNRKTWVFNMRLSYLRGTRYNRQWFYMSYY